jgi:hypothetical protein
VNPSNRYLIDCTEGCRGRGIGVRIRGTLNGEANMTLTATLGEIAGVMQPPRQQRAVPLKPCAVCARKSELLRRAAIQNKLLRARVAALSQKLDTGRSRKAGYAAAKIEKARAAGLCVRCRKVRACDSSSYCVACRDRGREACRLRRLSLRRPCIACGVLIHAESTRCVSCANRHPSKIKALRIAKREAATP